ncbi:hypothetical protein HDV00_004102 [Rhizophlyctis rosea]|nr:hypothetical protein HDV00_004102 [Rhizophlyctis rosea]
MPNKAVFKIGLSVKHPPPAATSDLPDDLNKRIRTLWHRINIAKNEKDWAELEPLYESLGQLYIDTEDVAKVYEVAELEYRLSEKFQGKDALRIKARALYRLGMSCRDHALKHQLQYAACAEKLKDSKETAQAYFDLGLTYIQRWESELQHPDDVQRAQEAYTKAISAVPNAGFSQSEAENFLAQIHMNLGITYTHQKDWSKAATYLRKALVWAKKALDLKMEADAYLNLAVCWDGKDGEKALQLTWRECNLREQMGDLEGQARALTDIGARSRKLWKYTEALAAYRTAVNKYEVMQDKDGRRRASSAIREIESAQQKEVEIRSVGEELQDERRHGVSGPRREFELLGKRANLLLELERPNEAIKDYEEQRKIALRLQMSKMLLEKVLMGLGKAYSMDGRPKDAVACYEDILMNYSGNDRARAEVLGLLGKALEEVGASHDRLTKTYDQMRDLAIKTEDLRLQHQALNRLAAVHAKFRFGGKAERCRVLMRQVEVLMGESGFEMEEDESLETGESFDPELGSADPDAFTDGEDSGKENGDGGVGGRGEREEGGWEEEEEEVLPMPSPSRHRTRRRSPSPFREESESPLKRRRVVKPPVEKPPVVVLEEEEEEEVELRRPPKRPRPGSTYRGKKSRAAADLAALDSGSDGDDIFDLSRQTPKATGSKSGGGARSAGKGKEPERTPIRKSPDKGVGKTGGRSGRRVMRIPTSSSPQPEPQPRPDPPRESRRAKSPVVIPSPSPPRIAKSVAVAPTSVDVRGGSKEVVAPVRRVFSRDEVDVWVEIPSPKRSGGEGGGTRVRGGGGMGGGRGGGGGDGELG